MRSRKEQGDPPEPLRKPRGNSGDAVDVREISKNVAATP